MKGERKRAKGRVSMSAGRFGPRYGRFVRKRVVEIEKVSKAFHTCPRCDTVSVKRAGTGIWHCRKCDFTFAGGAYQPQTPQLRVALRTIERSVQQSKE